MGSNQPCWTCKKACGHCDWSRFKGQTPVKGWEAKPVIVNGELVSYDIKNCPEYEADNGEKPKEFSIKQLAELFNVSYRHAVRCKDRLRERIKNKNCKNFK